jgi:hypothetical protein
MSFDYDAPVEDCADAVAAEIQQASIPEGESAELREWRIVENELREAADRQRRDEARARREFELAREEERRRQIDQAEAARALREKLDRQARERDARLDRERIAAITAHHQADQARRTQEAHQKAVNDYWQEIESR